MNNIPHITIYYVDCKTAKLKPKQLADKITRLVKDEKIPDNARFIKYIEIVKSDDGKSPSEDWVPGDMCMLMFSEKNLNGTISIKSIVEKLENDRECKESECVGAIETESLPEHEVKSNSYVIRLDV